MWRWLEKDRTPIPENKVEAYAKQRDWQKPNGNKQKKRNRTRYERPHTGDLIHGDWHRTTEDHSYMIAWLDDASRKVLAYGEFDRRSGEASIATLQVAQPVVRGGQRPSAPGSVRLGRLGAATPVTPLPAF